VSSIEAEFFDHRKDGIPFHEGWDDTLKAFLKSIPSIPDGGYTKGHFYEFADGKVSMRDTITSDIFHEHNYVGEGTLGIIREGLIRRIFGSTPFESATLEDIILPRHRPRVWDAKKMSNFTTKLHTIPAEFRSYYPCSVDMINDRSTLQMNSSKKRGRPLGSTTTDQHDKKTPKKTTNPLSGSNSIMKYFGSKVATAIAQPSKSVARLSSISVNLDIKSLSIIDALVEKTSLILPGIPYREKTMVNTIPMTIDSQTTLLILPPEIMDTIPMAIISPPEIIEVNEVQIENLYGFDWKHCSCAFDTPLTVLLYFYLYLCREEREEFVRALPFFGDIFKDIDFTSLASLAAAKLKLMRYFMSRQYKINKTYSIENVYNDIMHCFGSVIEQGDFLRIHYKVSCTCGNAECVGHGLVVRGEQRRDLNLFESSSIVDGKAGDYDIDHLMKNYWERKNHKCKSCGNLLLVSRIFHVPNPIILVFSLSKMNTLLNPVINFEGSNYDIFAVAYTDGVHYMARIKRHDGVYEYDGIYMRGRLQLLNRRDPFAERIISMSGSPYKAELAFYKKIVIA
jgi:hypothetical protein